MRRTQLLRADAVICQQRIGRVEHRPVLNCQTSGQAVEGGESIHRRRAIAKRQARAVVDENLPQHRRPGPIAQHNAVPVSGSGHAAGLVVVGGKDHRVERCAVGHERPLQNRQAGAVRKPYRCARRNRQHCVVDHRDALQHLHCFLPRPADRQIGSHISTVGIGPNGGCHIRIERIVAVNSHHSEIPVLCPVQVINLDGARGASKALLHRMAGDGTEIGAFVIELEPGKAKQGGGVIAVPGNNR